jgi:hypothetical protein
MLILLLLLAIILFVIHAVDNRGFRINLQSLGLAALAGAAIVYVL